MDNKNLLDKIHNKLNKASYLDKNGGNIFVMMLAVLIVFFLCVYYWILRKPQVLGYGFIFISGIINDVVFGIPFGINALSLLVIAGVASYVRVLTVRITLINDWISFLPALLLANFVYFLSLYFLNFSIDYLFLFTNSVFTFVFYPVLWGIFTLILNLTKS